MDQAKAAMNTIATTLREGEPSFGGGGGIVVNKVIKAGSLGHGTAVPGHYDLDVVLYSNSLDGNVIVERGFKHWTDIVQGFLDRKLPGRISNRHSTVHSSQFTFDGELEVDMLVSPFWRDHESLYRFLESIPSAKRPMFSVSASKWQVKFFQDELDQANKSQAKEFIKRAKAWRNRAWEGGREGRPKSYLISVIVLRAHEKARRMGDNSTRGMAINTTKQVKEIVINHMQANIYWEEYYQQGHPLFPRHLPRIVDPANPANNLHDSGICAPSNPKGYDYGEGGGRWDNFVHLVGSLDLTKTVEQIQAGQA